MRAGDSAPPGGHGGDGGPPGEKRKLKCLRSKMCRYFTMMSRSISVLLLWVSVGVMECSTVMYGQVQSPLYPEPYPAMVHQQWHLKVPTGYHLQLTFNYLDIEPSANCFYDSLTVMHGKKILGKFCGQNSTDAHHPGSNPVMSPGNGVKLVFVTDEYNPGPRPNLGFSAFYQAVDIDECSLPLSEDSEPLCSQICLNTLGSYLCACHHGYQLRADQRTCVLDCGGGVFREAEGTMSSPGYPNPSPLGLDCIYSISVPRGFTITLQFNHTFHIDHVYDNSLLPICPFHWLQVTIPGQKSRKYCGDKSPGVLHMASHTVELEYHTDGAGESGGWSLHYTTKRVECKLDKSISNGRVTPDFPHYHYRDYIHVRCDEGYKLMMVGMEIRSFKSMCQHDGQWHLPLPQCEIIDCGDPKPLLNGGVKFLSGSYNQYRSVIQYHCNQPYYSFTTSHNVTFTCSADRVWKENDNNAIIPPCLPVCGRPTVKLSSRARVLGGQAAPPQTFPWQVFLLSGGRAGAIVIGDRWIMTAAHNLARLTSKKDSVKMYVGSTIVSQLIKTPNLNVESLHTHPHYNADFDNDIALIKLKSPITFNAHVMPVCLPQQGTELSKFGWVSGFGLTEDETTADELRYIKLPVVDQNVCRESLESAKLMHNDVSPLTNNMFCAGLPEGGNDTCSGDSGSAFVMKRDDVHWVAGIVSWGVNCGLKGTYGVYTRVTRYMDWIHEIMREN